MTVSYSRRMESSNYRITHHWK